MTPLTTDPSARPLRLLIVDDQPLIRRGLAMMLEAEDGIEIVGQEQPEESHVSRGDRLERGRPGVPSRRAECGD